MELQHHRLADEGEKEREGEGIDTNVLCKDTYSDPLCTIMADGDERRSVRTRGHPVRCVVLLKKSGQMHARQSRRAPHHAWSLHGPHQARCMCRDCCGFGCALRVTGCSGMAQQFVRGHVRVCVSCGFAYERSLSLTASAPVEVMQLQGTGRAQDFLPRGQKR